MIKTKIRKIEKEEEYIDKAYCSFCGKEFNKTATSFEGYGEIDIIFGYGSDFDGNHFTLEICDDCFLKNYFNPLEEQFKEKGFNIEVIKEKLKEVRGK